MTKPVPLILHVGHVKTGSSFIQSSLVLSKDQLLEHGIIYPDFKSDHLASQGKISSGNIVYDLLLEHYWGTASEACEGQSIFFSHENLFFQLMKRPEVLDDLCARNVDIRMILFIRNPIAHVMSDYVQKVKSGGATRSISEFLADSNLPGWVVVFLNDMRRRGISVEVRNYSYHKDNLLAVMSNFLGVPAGCFVQPNKDRVNRSVTRSEFALQRLFNEAYGGQSGSFVTMPMCDALPDLSVEGGHPIDLGLYEDFSAKLRPAVDEANAMIDSEENYQIEPFDSLSFWPDGDEEDYRFSYDQLRVLTQAITGVIPSHAERGAFVQMLKKMKPGYVLSRQDMLVLNDIKKSLGFGARKPDQ